MKEIIKVIFMLIILSVPVISQDTITGEIVTNFCADSNTLFKTSSNTNAHAALWDDPSYSFKACTNGLTITDRTCNADNSDVIIKLSSNTNAHVEKPNLNNYNVKVCSDDLVCAYRTGCNPDEQCVASISSDTNAHVSDCSGGYTTKLCCKTAQATECSINVCEQNICNTDQNTCETAECSWDSDYNKCCPPGQIWDSDLNKCIYDPNGVTVILNIGEDSKFAFGNEIHELNFDAFQDAQTSIITVSSLPQTATLAVGATRDVNLNTDTIDDFRIRLNEIINPDPNTGSAEFTYLVSDSGLCTSNTCTSPVCNKGFGYCTLGTECNFYPPNKKASESGCCPNGFRWDSNDKACESFTDPSATCLNFNTFRAPPLPYEDVCCQVATAYGFWDPVNIY